MSEKGFHTIKIEAQKIPKRAYVKVRILTF